MFCSLCSLTISQFQALQLPGKILEIFTRTPVRVRNFCRNCRYKPVCSGMLFYAKEDFSGTALGGLLSFCFHPISHPVPRAAGHHLSRRRASVKAQPSGDTEKGESKPHQHSRPVLIWVRTAGHAPSPNRLCGTEELLWPWPQSAPCMGHALAQRPSKTLHLQEPDLKWRASSFLLTSSHSRVGPCLAWRAGPSQGRSKNTYCGKKHTPRRT